ncbi:MAG: hypothetical protein IPH20_20825 [Bacteroidales bacterium]|nr:hypothetical protein [Bacteroidales bacterium]
MWYSPATGMDAESAYEFQVKHLIISSVPHSSYLELKAIPAHICLDFYRNRLWYGQVVRKTGYNSGSFGLYEVGLAPMYVIPP